MLDFASSSSKSTMVQSLVSTWRFRQSLTRSTRFERRWSSKLPPTGYSLSWDQFFEMHAHAQASTQSVKIESGHVAAYELKSAYFCVLPHTIMHN